MAIVAPVYLSVVFPDGVPRECHQRFDGSVWMKIAEPITEEVDDPTVLEGTEHEPVDVVS